MLCLIAELSKLSNSSKFDFLFVRASFPASEMAAAHQPENQGFVEAVEATKHLLLRDVGQHVAVGPMPRGTVNPSHLPLKQITDKDVIPIKHFFDVCYDCPAPNYDMLGPIIRDKAWAELPAPFSLKSRFPIDYDVQFFIYPQEANGFTIVKHYCCNEKVKPSLVIPFVQGTAFEVRWSGNIRTARKALQFMLEQMGGMQYRLHSLVAQVFKSSSKNAPKEKSEEELQAGFQFIIDEGERDKGNLKQLLWIQTHISKQGCPIFGWREGLVQRALDNLSNDTTMAALVDRHDLTMGDYYDEIVEVYQIVAPYFEDHSFWMLGEPGKGKTPNGRTVAMMMSRHHGGVGQYRSASDFDYFRGCPFSKKVSAIYDDGEIGNEPIKKKKAFSDVSDTETLTRERWTAAKFVQHQCRIVIDNLYDPAAEPELPQCEPKSTITHEDFMKMIRPALGCMSKVDAMAILKRAVFMIFSKKSIIYRVPGEDERPVPRISWDKDIIKPSSKAVLSNFKKNGPAPANFEEAVAWEQEWLKESIRKFRSVSHVAPLISPSSPKVVAACQHF